MIYFLTIIAIISTLFIIELDCGSIVYIL
jgi:hypothetical protein